MELRAHDGGRRCGRAEPGRLEGEHLLFLGERRLDLGERCAATRGNHQLRGIVVDDARVLRRVEGLAGKLLSVEILAAASGEAQRSPGGCRASHVLAPALDDVISRVHYCCACSSGGSTCGMRSFSDAESAAHSCIARSASSALR